MIELLDLRADTCRYQVAEAQYCGDQPVTGKPYCPAHCKLSYVASRPSVRDTRPSHKGLAPRAGG